MVTLGEISGLMFADHLDRSGLIWQVEKKKGRWKTLNNTVCALLEEAFQTHQMDIKHKDLVVSVEMCALGVITEAAWLLAIGEFGDYGDVQPTNRGSSSHPP